MNCEHVLALPEARLHSRSKLGRTHAHWKKMTVDLFRLDPLALPTLYTRKKTPAFCFGVRLNIFFRIAGIYFLFPFSFSGG